MPEYSTGAPVRTWKGLFGPQRSLLSPIFGFARRSKRRRKVAWDALLQLLHAWTLVRMRSFSAYASGLGTVSNGDPDWIWTGDVRFLIEVRWAVERWTRLSNARFTCLMKAMAAQAILARRGIDSAVVLGVKPGAPDEDPTAHAWLRVGQHILVGGEERKGHIPVASYRRSGD